MKTKLIVIVLSLLLVVISCRKDDEISYGGSDAIVSTSSVVTFEELLMLIELITIDTAGNPLNIVTDKLCAVQLNINNENWGVYASTDYDTSLYNVSIYQNVHITTSKLNYLVIANYENTISNYTTVGDYVNYMKGLLVPGDYVCEISKIKFLDLNNDTITVSPGIYKNFTVTEGMKSTFLGDFDIIVNL